MNRARKVTRLGILISLLFALTGGFAGAQLTDYAKSKPPVAPRPPKPDTFGPRVAVSYGAPLGDGLHSLMVARDRQTGRDYLIVCGNGMHSGHLSYDFSTGCGVTLMAEPERAAPMLTNTIPAGSRITIEVPAEAKR